MNNENKKYIFHVDGMHCNACVLLIESEIGDLSNVSFVRADLNKHAVEVSGNFGDKNPEQIAKELSLLVKSGGHTLSVEKKHKEKDWSDFKFAVPFAVLFAVFFVMLQKIGLISLVGGGETNYGTSFLIGVVASVSSCMAVVGGLVLSMSATFAKNGDRVRPQIMFHLGRIVSFFILGGIIGALGSVFTLNSNATFILGLIIGIVMLIMGLNLLEVFPWAKKLQPKMPKFIASRAHSVSKLNHSVTPILVGIATFFLPCGFTQSMQIFTLTTGSFLKGGLTMLAFALGTLPVLALVSFSSLSIRNSNKAGIFFKTAGLIVILFALFNLINSLVVIGMIPPIFNF